MLLCSNHGLVNWFVVLARLFRMVHVICFASSVEEKCLRIEDGYLLAVAVGFFGHWFGGSITTTTT
jgi:hypothetical protein